MTTYREFHGTIRGHLTGINLARGRRASVHPHGGGPTVRVVFPLDLLEPMRHGLGSFVEVDGLVRQNAEGRNFRIAAESIRLIPENPRPWKELYGLIPEITEGLPVREYLELIRGEG